MKKGVYLYLEGGVWKEFLEIARREGESGSVKAEKLFRNYNEQHRVGNPQTRLDKLIQTKITRKCSHPSCEETATYEVWGENKTHAFLCNFHRERDKKLLKRVRRL